MKTRKTLAERLRELNERWFLREPALFMLLSSHELLAKPEIRTLRSGKGRIEYNPIFLEELDDAALDRVLKAEGVRVLLRHPYRYPPRRGELSYIASNITVNEWYEGLDLPHRARDFWQDAGHDKQNFEFYYRELCRLSSDVTGTSASAGGDGASHNDNMHEGHNNNDGHGDSHNNNDNNGDSHTAHAAHGDSHTKNTKSNTRKFGTGGLGVENTALWDQDDFYDEQVRELIDRIQQNDQWGTLSRDFVELICASLKPEIDYRRVLSGFRSSIIASKPCLTRFKPSRRYGFMYMGNRRRFTTALLVGVDVSGSLSAEQLSEFFSVVNRFFKYGIERIEVQQFDCELKGEPLVLKKARKTIEVQGRGGTSFDPVIDFFVANQKKYDGLIIFTDGFAEVPKVPAQCTRKILWVCSSKQDYDCHHEWMRKLGRCCWIE
jgi:hypothetical protein